MVQYRLDQRPLATYARTINVNLVFDVRHVDVLRKIGGRDRSRDQHVQKKIGKFLAGNPNNIRLTRLPRCCH